jgi:hypothetical protein
MGARPSPSNCTKCRDVDGGMELSEPRAILVRDHIRIDDLLSVAQLHGLLLVRGTRDAHDAVLSFMRGLTAASFGALCFTRALDRRLAGNLDEARQLAEGALGADHPHARALLEAIRAELAASASSSAATAAPD